MMIKGLSQKFRYAVVFALPVVSAVAVLRVLTDGRKSTVSGGTPFSESAGSTNAPVLDSDTSAPDPHRLSPAVRVFASLSGAVPAAARRRRLAEFPDSLSVAESAALTNFLATAESRISGVAPRDALSLKNDAANALLARAPGGAGLAAFFAAQSLDSRNSRGWRDYALQFLPFALLRDRSPASLRAAGETYAAAFSEPRLRRFRGTALNGLAGLERAGVRLAGVSAGAAAPAVLRDRDSDECALLAALAICRERGCAPPELSRLAASSTSPLVRRLAAAILAEDPGPAKPIDATREVW